MIKQKYTNTGVSDALGYILVFSIILSSVAVGFTIGLPELESAQEREQIQNIERSYDIIKTNMNDVVWNMEIRRSTQIKLEESQLRGGETQNVAVNIPPQDRTITIDYTPMVYDAPGDTEFTYENGAVIRSSGQYGDIMIHDPQFQEAGGELLVPFIETRQRGDNISGGTRDIEKQRVSDGFITEVDVSNDDDANISVTTEYPDAWLLYFSEQEFTESCIESNPNEVTCEFDDSVETLQIRSIAVDFRFR